MKIEATKTTPITVDIDDEEIYRIAKEEILRIYDIPSNYKNSWYDIRGGVLCEIWLETYGPYDPDEMMDKIRTATKDDVYACAVLEKLQDDYKGFKYAKR